MPGGALTAKSQGREETLLISLSIAIGLLTPPAVWLLSRSLKLIFSTTLQATGDGPGYLLLVLPAIPMFAISSLIVTYLATESEGPGLHIVIASYFRRSGRLRPKTAPSKFLSTLLIVGAGTASGIAGPLTLIGAGISSLIGRLLSIRGDIQKTLMLSGVAAAISTLLGTPLGAAIFAVELVYGKRILYRRFFYPLLASITAYLFSIYVKLNSPRLVEGAPPPLTLSSAAALILTAVVVVALNIGYIFLYQRLHDSFGKLHLKLRWKWLVPFSGSLTAFIILLPIYHALIELKAVAGGRLEIGALDNFTPTWLLLTALIIMISTALLSSSGGSGGLFMPVITVGAITGHLMGRILLPGSSTIFLAAGLSAALSTTLNVPLAAAVITIEMLGEGTAFPAAVGSLAGYLLARRFVIYHEIRWEGLKGE